MAAADQPVDDDRRLAVLEVEADAADIAVGAEIESADIARPGLPGAGPVPLEGAAGRLDLDDVGAHIGQILHGGRPLQIVTEAQDLHALENHAAPPNPLGPCLKALSIAPLGRRSARKSSRP